MPVSAKENLNKYFKSEVFSDAVEGVDKYTCNITLTRRPQAKELKYSTKADKNIAKKTDYEINKKPDNKEDRILYRLTIDMRSINAATRNDVTIVLPSIETIERARFSQFHRKHF